MHPRPHVWYPARPARHTHENRASAGTTTSRRARLPGCTSRTGGRRRRAHLPIDRYLEAYGRYDAEAKLEGWALFRTDDAKLGIQKIDDPALHDSQLIWKTDVQAIEFVALRALDGSAPHQATLVIHLADHPEDAPLVDGVEQLQR